MNFTPAALLWTGLNLDKITEVPLASALPFLPLLMPSVIRTRTTHPAVFPLIPYSLVPPTPLKDATSPTSTVSQRLSSQIFQAEIQNLAPPQLLHPSILLSQLLFPVHICTAGHGEDAVTSPAHLQSTEKG